MSHNGKPTIIITASTGGFFGHQALMETLKAIQAKNIENLQVVIPFAKTKISMDDKIFDSSTRVEVETLLEKFIETINNN